MAVPVVFLMISNHFPGVTYGDRYNWIILVGAGAAGLDRREVYSTSVEDFRAKTQSAAAF